MQSNIRYVAGSQHETYVFQDFEEDEDGPAAEKISDQDKVSTSIEKPES